MCGIFGLLIPKASNISHQEITLLLKQLYLYSESRGKESAGIHLYLPSSQLAWTLKNAGSATTFTQSEEYQHILATALDEASKTKSEILVIAHSRLVTNGGAEDNDNNQPVHYNGLVLIHNGIIVNVEELWANHPNLTRYAKVDTEVAAALLEKACADNLHPMAATNALFSEIKGAASIAWLHDNSDFVVLATNTGDLFYHQDAGRRLMSFASERYILESALNTALIFEKHNKPSASWVEPRRGMYIRLADLNIQPFFTTVAPDQIDLPRPSYQHKTQHKMLANTSVPQSNVPNIIKQTADESLLRYNSKNLQQLTRCTACILPDTFPFIFFDEKGICNYCHGYQTKYKNIDPVMAKKDFIALVQKYKVGRGKPEVIVPFSGGRDSCYGLHLIKNEFGLMPVTFTYDWGMVTELARRNIARFCGQLGVQNILVSANIQKKRENIRKNVSAWLKKPDLGMIPLFMAGDKHFFSLVNKLKAQTNIKLDLWCANPLENTDFKSGFCGVAPDFAKKRLDYLSVGRKLKMISHFAKQFMTNPGYINSSLIDTLTSFFAYYIEPRRDFYFIFNHMLWDENEVNNTIIGEYDFEMSPDSTSTWRIGDGTAPFYNYIYLTAGGFSEFDTFRSNQIREGMITREEALEKVLVENRPRTASLRWYLETIGLDFNDTIRQINMLDTKGLHT